MWNFILFTKKKKKSDSHFSDQQISTRSASPAIWVEDDHGRKEQGDGYRPEVGLGIIRDQKCQVEGHALREADQGQQVLLRCEISRLDSDSPKSVPA